MPNYEYICETNGRVLEVRHKIAEQVRNWGELCELAGLAPGKTSPAAPVKKLISAGYIKGQTAPEKDPAFDIPSCPMPSFGGCGSGCDDDDC